MEKIFLCSTILEIYILGNYVCIEHQPWCEKSHQKGYKKRKWTPKSRVPAPTMRAQ